MGKRVGGSAWGGSAFGVRRRSAVFGGVQRSAFGVRRSAGAVRTSAGVCKSNVAVGRKLRRKIGKNAERLNHAPLNAERRTLNVPLRRNLLCDLEFAVFDGDD